MSVATFVATGEYL